MFEHKNEECVDKQVQQGLSRLQYTGNSGRLVTLVDWLLWQPLKN